jgi:voltage-gated potassium channel
MSLQTPAAFSEDLDRVDALYFTMTVFATVGFGDITPVTRAARAVVTIQMVANLLVLTLLLRLVTRAVQINRGRRNDPDRHA